MKLADVHKGGHDSPVLPKFLSIVRLNIIPLAHLLNLGLVDDSEVVHSDVY